MSKPSSEVKNLLNASSSSINTKTKESIMYAPPLEAAPPLSHAVAPEIPDDDFKSVFIDTLTVNDEGNQPIPGAAEKVQAMRNMRFKPAKRYADQNLRDAQLRTDPQSTYYTVNGVRFLKPMENPNEIKFENFSKANRVQVIENRTPWQSFTRAVSMFFQTLFTGGLGGIRLLSKMKQILPGNFGYAQNMDGDIEIYPASTERRIGLSPWTNIEVASITEPYVNIFNRIHLVNVPEGKYATAMKDRHPVFLPAGRHIIESIDFNLDMEGSKPKFINVNETLVSRGDSYIIRVPQGHVAFGDINGQPQILEPEHGPYIFHDPTFKLANSQSPFQNIGESLVGGNNPVRVVTVKQTHALISNENGDLLIHRGGRHPLVNANHVCDVRNAKNMFDLTQQKIEITDKNDIFISKDGVQLTVHSEMLFKIKDVEKCIKNVGEDYKGNITSRAQHIIRELLKSNNYLNTGELHGASTQPSTSREMVPHDHEKAEEQLIQTIGRTLRERLQEALDKEGGIELHDVLITNLLPLSQDLRKSIESNANVIAEAHRETTKAQLDQQIAKTKADTSRMTSTITAQQNAEVLAINTKAAADAKKIELSGAASAEAEAARIKTDAQLHIVKRTAETNAEATITSATADKRAHELKAEGLKAYDETGKQIQLLNAQAGVAKGLLEGADLKLISQSVGDVGNMMMNSVAGMLFTGNTGRPKTLNHQDTSVVHSHETSLNNK